MEINNSWNISSWGMRVTASIMVTAADVGRHPQPGAGADIRRNVMNIMITDHLQSPLDWFSIYHLSNVWTLNMSLLGVLLSPALHRQASHTVCLPVVASLYLVVSASRARCWWSLVSTVSDISLLPRVFRIETIETMYTTIHCHTIPPALFSLPCPAHRLPSDLNLAHFAHTNTRAEPEQPRPRNSSAASNFHCLAAAPLELQRRFAKISQSRRRPLLRLFLVEST